MTARLFISILALVTFSTFSFGQTPDNSGEMDIETALKLVKDTAFMKEHQKFLDKYGESLSLESDADDKMKEGDFTGAIVGYSNAIKKPHPTKYELYFKRAGAKFKAGDNRGAI